METLVVVFTKNNARIFRNPENLDELSEMPNSAVNPDLSLVANLPPHFWKLSEGKVIPMTEDEMSYRLDSLSCGVDNEVKPIKKIKYRKLLTLSRMLLINSILTNILCGYLVYKCR